MIPFPNGRPLTRRRPFRERVGDAIRWLNASPAQAIGLFVAGALFVTCVVLFIVAVTL